MPAGTFLTSSLDEATNVKPLLLLLLFSFIARLQIMLKTSLIPSLDEETDVKPLLLLLLLLLLL